MMTLALKVIAMFTLGMGTLILESVILINGWMSAYLVLVTGGFIILSNIKKIKNKTGLQPVSRPVELVHYCGG